MCQSDCSDKSSKKLIRSNTLPLICIPEITFRLAGHDSYVHDNNSPSSSSKHSRPSITIDDTSVEVRRKSSSSSAKQFYKSTSSIIKNQLYLDDADFTKSSKNRFSYGFVPQFNIFHKRTPARDCFKATNSLRRFSLERWVASCMGCIVWILMTFSFTGTKSPPP